MSKSTNIVKEENKPTLTDNLTIKNEPPEDDKMIFVKKEYDEENNDQQILKKDIKEEW
mgnify:CR=1 FL=1